MMLDARTSGLHGVLYDTGTGKRIPFARRYDPDTGEYEHFLPAPNGVDVIGDDCGVPLLRRGKARGKLVLLDDGKAAHLGVKPAPAKVVPQTVEPMTAEERIEGLEVYKRCYFQVNNEFRGEAKRNVNDKWQEYLKGTGFLDHFLLTKVTVPIRR